ncbi:hypothetical protein HDV05_002495, partial [Chytridiales sp. JEL 0842]
MNLQPIADILRPTLHLLPGTSLGTSIANANIMLALGILMVGFLLYFTIMALRNYLPSKKRAYSHIPGPPVLPVLGHIPLFFPSVRLGRLHQVRDSIREKYGPMAYIQLFGKDVILLSDAESSLHVLRDTDDFKRSDTFQKRATGVFKYPLFLMPTDDMWRKHRKYMQPGFGPSQLRHGLEATNDALDTLFDIWNTHLHSDASAKDSSLAVLRADISHVAS